MPGDRRWFERHFRVARTRPIRAMPREELQCKECDGYFWEDPRVRCVQCNRFRDLYYKGKALAKNEAGICICGTKHTQKDNKKFCLCSCECSDPDERGDPNYEEDSEELDDDVETKFLGLARAAEEPFARKYGFQTAGWIDRGKKSERPFFFESLTHRTVAHMHDIGIPEESSMANSDNIITNIEANILYKGLEPWEFEAVEQCSGKDRRELLRMFPEAHHFQFSDPESVRLQPMPRYYCSNCHRLFSLETMERLSQRTMAICEGCCMVQRPANPVDDPEWWQFNPSIDGTMENCHCRCRCSPEDVTMTSPPEAVDQALSDAALQEREQLRLDIELQEQALREGVDQSRQRQEQLIQQLEDQVTQFEGMIVQQAHAIINGHVDREDGTLQLEALRQQSRELQAFIQRERDDQRAANAVTESGLETSAANRTTINIRRGRRGQLIIDTSVPRIPQALESASPSPMQVETAIRAYAGNTNNESPTEQDHAARERLRQQFGLPEMRFSNHPDPVARIEEIVRFALEDAQVAHSLEELEKARQYASVARDLAPLARLPPNHQLIVEAERHIAELDGIIAENNNAEVNSALGRNA